MRIPLCPAIDLEPGDELRIRYDKAWTDPKDGSEHPPMIVIRRKRGDWRVQQAVEPELIVAAFDPDAVMAKFFQCIEEEFLHGASGRDGPDPIGILNSEG